MEKPERRSSTASTSRSPASRSTPARIRPAALTSGLAAIVEQAAQQAKQAFDAGNDAGTAAPIEAGLTALRALRAQLGVDGAQRRGALRDRLPAEEQGTRLRGRGARGARPDVRRRRRRRARDRRAAGQRCRSSPSIAARRTSRSSASRLSGFDGAGRVHAGHDQEGRASSPAASTATVPKNAKLDRRRTSRTTTGRTRRARRATRSIRACRSACRSRRRRSARSSTSRRAASR